MKFLHPIYRAFSKGLEIIVSRKFLILLLTSFLLSKGLISSTEFMPIVLAVLGIQGYLDNKNPPSSFHETEGNPQQ